MREAQLLSLIIAWSSFDWLNEVAAQLLGLQHQPTIKVLAGLNLQRRKKPKGDFEQKQVTQVVIAVFTISTVSSQENLFSTWNLLLSQSQTVLQ